MKGLVTSAYNGQPMSFSDLGWFNATEARLINWALNGEFKGLDRDSLSDYELDLLAHLEMQDLILIGSKCTYEQRKTALKGFATSYQAKRLDSSQALLGAMA